MKGSSAFRIMLMAVLAASFMQAFAMLAAPADARPPCVENLTYYNQSFANPDECNTACQALDPASMCGGYEAWMVSNACYTDNPWESSPVCAVVCYSISGCPYCCRSENPDSVKSDCECDYWGYEYDSSYSEFSSSTATVWVSDNRNGAEYCAYPGYSYDWTPLFIASGGGYWGSSIYYEGTMPGVCSQGCCGSTDDSEGRGCRDFEDLSEAVGTGSWYPIYDGAGSKQYECCRGRTGMERNENYLCPYSIYESHLGADIAFSYCRSWISEVNESSCCYASEHCGNHVDDDCDDLVDCEDTDCLYDRYYCPVLCPDDVGGYAQSVYVTPPFCTYCKDTIKLDFSEDVRVQPPSTDKPDYTGLELHKDGSVSSCKWKYEESFTYNDDFPSKVVVNVGCDVESGPPRWVITYDYEITDPAGNWYYIWETTKLFDWRDIPVCPPDSASLFTYVDWRSSPCVDSDPNDDHPCT